jgi:hypothetical protein
MKKRLVWPAVAALTVTLGLVAPAQAATVAPSAAAPTTVLGHPVPANLSPELRQIVDNLPALRAHAEAVQADLGVEASPLQSALIDAIDPSGYECPVGDPAVVKAVLPDVTGWTFEQALAALHVLIYNMSLMDAAFLPQTGPYTFGARGDFTHVTTKAFSRLQNFWDIPSGDIQLVPAHGRSMLDPEVNYRVFTVLYGLPAAPSRVSADLVAKELNSPALGYGDLPLFTFNAFAAPGGEDVPGYGKSPKRIAFGDGVLDGFAKVGLGDVAPAAILAHEFGHHIQYADDLMATDLPAPEASRWAELMADSFSSYFLTHAHGETMQWKRVRQFGQMFSQLGDCGFTAAGHHGTPNQRMNSALWAYGIANSARPQGKVLPAMTFYSLFAAHYPELIAPDADPAGSDAAIPTAARKAAATIS